MPSPSRLTISVIRRLGRAEATFLSRTSSPTDEKRSPLVSNDEERGELIISKDLGLSRAILRAPKVQLESLILAQNER